MKENFSSFIKEVVKFTLIAVIIVVPIRTYVAQPFIVSGPSMNPTFVSGEYLIVDQITYRFREPQRGDVIIFKYPLNTKTYFIKRIVGLPGETLSVRKGVVEIDGVVVEDPNAKQPIPTGDNFDITLGETEYFVMGDNRAESSDSRIWGPLEKKYIVGRPILSLFPLSKIGIFPGEQK